MVVLGVGVANVVSVLDPELIVFNGGIVRGAPELLIGTVENVVRRIHPKPPRIRLSTLGDKAQIWGALHTLFEPEKQPAIRPALSRTKSNVLCVMFRRWLCIEMRAEEIRTGAGPGAPSSPTCA